MLNATGVVHWNPLKRSDVRNPEGGVWCAAYNWIEEGGMASKSKPTAGKKSRAKPSDVDLDDQLERGLEATFPASDPVAVGQPTRIPSGPVDRKPAVIDKRLVDNLAKKVDEKQKRPSR